MKGVTSLRRWLGRPTTFARTERGVGWRPTATVRRRELLTDAGQAFAAAGYARKDFFPHFWHVLPKSGPDGARLAKWMTGSTTPRQWWQIVLFVASPMVEQFPAELFDDREVLWHEQQFGQPGQVASANLVVANGVVYATLLQSDLVQRIWRRPDVRTRVRRSLKGWRRLLLNAVVDFARERGLHEIRVPTSTVAMRHTDPTRQVKAELFERVYDKVVTERYPATSVDGWWRIKTSEVPTIITPSITTSDRHSGKTVCVVHDIERGLGHVDVDPDFAHRAEQQADEALDEMLRIEAAAGVEVTYNVVATLIPEVRPRVERGGHAMAFHSFDHVRGTDQLARCRDVDYRLKGYRPPQSKLTAELTTEQLLWHNFEWFASSTYSLDLEAPRLADRLVQIPIHFDDYPMHADGMSYETWRRQIVDAVRAQEFVAFGLHDCYAPHWLPDYPGLLRELQSIASVTTMDQVANDLYLAAGE